MKTIKEINAKIGRGRAVVVTAEEIIDLVSKKGVRKAAREVDVVTTATFGPMCSSGAYFNIGHSRPRIKLGGGSCTLNGVPLYAAFGAVDVFLGAAAVPDDDPRNKVFPGEFNYGGGHVIQELVAGKDVRLEGGAYGTDCYPRKKLETLLNIRDLNEAVLFNMRNCYQNYNVAVNLSGKTVFTYMGMLKPHLGNANYSSAGQLSPLLKDPYYRTIGIGTRIFLGGGTGYVAWQGTQHNPCAGRGRNGVPLSGAGTLAVIGDLKQMSPEWLVGTSMAGYGATLSVGIGVPIPVLDEEVVRRAAVTDAGIYAPVVDYGRDYPQRRPRVIAEVSYAELRSGSIKLKGRSVPTGSLSSYARARKIAGLLKSRIEKREFFLSEPSAALPGAESGYKVRPLKERPYKKE